MSAPKRGRGRPAADGQVEGGRETLSLRVSADERARWTKAAARAGAKRGEPLSLAAWVRMVCEEASR